MKTKIETIPVPDFNKALDNWCKHNHDDAGRRFMQYLEVNHYYNGAGAIKSTPEAICRIRLLTGPHYLTVIKAWYAKNEQAKTEPVEN